MGEELQFYLINYTYNRIIIINKKHTRVTIIHGFNGEENHRNKNK